MEPLGPIVVDPFPPRVWLVVGGEEPICGLELNGFAFDAHRHRVPVGHLEEELVRHVPVKVVKDYQGLSGVTVPPDLALGGGAGPVASTGDALGVGSSRLPAATRSHEGPHSGVHGTVSWLLVEGSSSNNRSDISQIALCKSFEQIAFARSASNSFSKRGQIRSMTSSLRLRTERDSARTCKSSL